MRYEKKSSDYICYHDFAMNKAKRLLIPYFFVTVVWVMPIYAYFNRPTINILIKKFILMEGPSQLWFLIMLFGCSIVFYLLSDYVRAHTIAGGMITILFYGLGIVGLRIFDNYFQIWSICKYLFFFFIGFKFRQMGFEKLESVTSVIYLFIDFALFGIWYMCSNILRIRILSGGLLFLLNMIGSIGSFVILQKLADTKKENKIGAFLSKHNMTIYLFHQQLVNLFCNYMGKWKGEQLFISRNEFCFIFFGGFSYFSNTQSE